MNNQGYACEILCNQHYKLASSVKLTGYVLQL